MTDIEAQTVRSMFSSLAEKVVAGDAVRFFQHSDVDDVTLEELGRVTVITVSTNSLPPGPMELRVGDKVVARTT